VPDVLSTDYKSTFQPPQNAAHAPLWSIITLPFRQIAPAQAAATNAVRHRDDVNDKSAQGSFLRGVQAFFAKKSELKF
jgi:hypothetical protein